MSRYIHHVTLTTGDTRRSWRHEIDPSIVPHVAELVESAREETGALIPGLDPECWLHITDTARCALATVRLADDTPILTFGIADHARCGSQIWELLHDTAMPVATSVDRKPEHPWCAVRLDAGAALFLEPHPLLPALADMERCLAWAWLERRK